MLAWIDKWPSGPLNKSLKLILFDAERRTFAIQGELPLSDFGEPLADGEYTDFLNHWSPKVMQAYFNNKDKTITGKVKYMLNSI